MRLFITSYQKSGTHQIMPALGATKQIVGRAYVDMAAVKGYGAEKINYDGISATCTELREFEERAFGHLPYLPEYAEAIQVQPTKVLFNVRDPRDVVVSNFHNINKIYYRTDPPGQKGYGHLNMMNSRTKKLLIHSKDPIGELIKIESQRWPKWLGWLDHEWTMMVKYEDLRTSPSPTVKKIAKFLLPYEIKVEKVIGLLPPSHGNSTFRAGRVGDWVNDFQPHHKKLAEKLLGETIVKLGYEI